MRKKNACQAPAYSAAKRAESAGADRALCERRPGGTPPSFSQATRLLIPCCGVGLLVLFSVLCYSDNALYLAILKWMIGGILSPRPFRDWEWIPSAVECWQRHVDVYVNNSCYYLPAPHGHNYSPLWLRMTFLPYGAAWVVPFGLGFGLLFFASLAALPPQPRTLAACVTFLATFSSSTAYALERGNADLIMFLMVIAGTGCWLRSLRWRLLGYGIFLLAGLLKFYPCVLLVLALRERPRAFVGVWAAAVAILGAFVLTFHDELSRIGGNFPSGGYFEGTFAAHNLPHGVLIAAGIETGTDEQRDWTGYLLPAWLLILTLAAICGADRLSRRFRLDVALAAMPKWETGLLISGATLICGCFFAGLNANYRAIMLLLALPGLLWLGRSMPDRAGRAAFMTTTCLIVFVMWTPPIQQAILQFTSGFAYFLGHWLLNEVAWWCVVCMLLAVLFGFVRGSPIGLLLPRRRLLL